jgi:GNAT superfamily N-acetyltransferase
MRSTVTIVPASVEHRDAIVEIERASASGSLVALTHGHALDEAFERGHDVIVALNADIVIGWAWFSMDAGRGGECVGVLYRIAVPSGGRRSGVGRGLLERVREQLSARGCSRIRTTFSGDDTAAREFFAAAGFALDSVTMEQAL